MGFIFFNIKKWYTQEQNWKKDRSADEKMARREIARWEESNHAIHFEKIVLYEDEIIPLIMSEIDIENCFESSYWNKKNKLKYSVFCIIENIVLSYDYFLNKDNLLNYNSMEFVKYLLLKTGRDNLLKEANKIDLSLFIGNSYEYVEAQYLTLNYQLSMIEVLLSEQKINSYNELNNLAQNRQESTKKKLNAGKFSVQRLFQDVFEIDFKKYPKKDISKLRLLALLYHFDKIGIPIQKDKRKCLYICDILKQARLENVNKELYNKPPTEAALHIELFRNEIIKNINHNRIIKINEIYAALNAFAYEKTKYMNFIIDDNRLSEANKKDELNRIKILLTNLEFNLDNIDSRPYENNIFEEVFLKYNGYINKCGRIASIESLRFVLGDTEIPSKIPFLELYNNLDLKYGEIKIEQIDEYINKHCKIISTFVLDEYNPNWIHTRKELISNLYHIIANFNGEIKCTGVTPIMLFSMFQAINEVENRKYKYENNYRNYKGNKKVSIISKLKDISNADKSVELIFHYIWIALVKKWFMFNECNFELWKLTMENEIKFHNLVSKVGSANSVLDIEYLIKGIDLELCFPNQMDIFTHKKNFYTEIYESTGFKIEVIDEKLYGYFDNILFVQDLITQIIQLSHLDEVNTAIYYIVLRKIILKVEKNYQAKSFKIVEVRIVVDQYSQKIFTELGFKNTISEDESLQPNF